MDSVQSQDDLPPEHFDATFGLELIDANSEVITARVPVTARIKQPFGVVHGGLYCSVAESLASIGTWLAVRDQGKIALGVSNQTSFLRPITEGYVNGEAKPIHSGRTTWVWDVQMTDDQGRLCAVSRMTIAVRDMPSA